MGHEDAEGMAHVGVRVERPVRRRLVRGRFTGGALIVFPLAFAPILRRRTG